MKTAAVLVTEMQTSRCLRTKYLSVMHNADTCRSRSYTISELNGSSKKNVATLLIDAVVFP